MTIMVSATSTFETDESTPGSPPAGTLIVRFGPVIGEKRPLFVGVEKQLVSI
jgi:hypothetical protein